MRRTINSFKINNNFSGNLAVFCSDERFIESNLAFLRNSLKIKQSDLFSIPGGVAFIAKNESNLLDRLGILVEAHSITQIILISHSDCGYYKIITGESSDEEILKIQLNDIQESIIKLRKIFKNISVEGFYA
jgi:carbonic anhydrase